MKKFLGIVVLGLLVCGLAQAASSLPECKESNPKKWTNCQGTHTWASGKFAGDKYVGEHKDGQQHGQGTYIYANGDKYVGEFKGSEQHGQGTYIHADGKIEKGIWKDGELIRIFEY
jgi:hypothetical protein